MAEMTINNEIFNVLVEGADDAPALILSNSLGTNLHMWDRQIPALIERFRVVRYDSRGHGGSAVAEGPYSIEQLGADALSIMDALEIDRAHWLGLSKGGMVGQWLLIHAPHRIERAVLANTTAHLPPPDLWNERIRTVRASGMEAITPTVLERWFTRSFQARDPDAVNTLRSMLLAISADGYAACCAAIRDMDMREAVRDIEKEVLVIVGKHDPTTPPEHGQLLADSIRGARLVTLDAAHLSNIEATEAFNEAVVSFLTEQKTDLAPERRRRRVTPRTRQSAGKKVQGKQAAGKQAAGKQAGGKQVAGKQAASKQAAGKKRAFGKRAVAAKKSAAASVSRRGKAAPAKKTRTQQPAKKAAAKQRTIAKSARKKSAKKVAVATSGRPKKTKRQSTKAAQKRLSRRK